MNLKWIRSGLVSIFLSLALVAGVLTQTKTAPTGKATTATKTALIDLNSATKDHKISSQIIAEQSKGGR